MAAIHQLSNLSPDELADSAMQADQLLRVVQKVLSHDLPNQMVILQSLLQLLNEEESARLSGDGREYVRRLLNATKRASEMVRFLKEMGRVSAFTSKSETISLSALVRELQGELQRLHPAKQFEFDWQWKTPAIRGDARVFLQAILELFAGFLYPQSMSCRVSARSETLVDAVELTFALEERPTSTQPRGNPQTLDQRMEIILAREWLALCGTSVEVTLLTSGGARFVLVVPNH
jgi:light-regulated signal transduction histidine kinase (bacteriophytochrome)